MNEKIQKILGAWFQEERGNRVTMNNFQMLVILINDAFKVEETDGEKGE